jgi:serine protease Do
MLSSQKIIRSLTLLLLVIFGTASSAKANNEVFKSTLKSTCWVIAKTDEGTFTGTGVVVDKEKKYVITNAHVVGKAKKVTIMFPEYEDGKLINAKKKYIDKVDKNGIKGRVYEANPTVDLALIVLKSLPENIPAIKMAANSVGSADEVHSVGNPGASGALWIYTLGTVRAIYQKQFRTEIGPHDFRAVETSSPINKGDSGGPVVNGKGELIAISQSLDPKARLISFCVDISEIKKFLAKKRRPISVDAEIILAKAGLKYKESEAGPLSVNIKIEKDSKQEFFEVFVADETEFFEKVETRRLWSLAKILSKPPTVELTLKLLDQNSRTKMGAWTIERNANRYLVVFVARIDVSASPEALKDAMNYISQVVQHMQKELKPLK